MASAVVSASRRVNRADPAGPLAPLHSIWRLMAMVRQRSIPLSFRGPPGANPVMCAVPTAPARIPQVEVEGLTAGEGGTRWGVLVEGVDAAYAPVANQPTEIPPAPHRCRRSPIRVAMGFDAFLSYRRGTAAEHAKRLHRTLQATGLRVFIDERGNLLV